MKKHGLTGYKHIRVALYSALLTMAVLAGCKNQTHSPQDISQAPQYTVTFRVSGSDGELEAKIGNTEIKTGRKVTKGQTVTFTAKPKAGYIVSKWTISKSSFTKGGATGNETAEMTVSADTTVEVSFQSKQALTKPKVTTEVGNKTVTLKWEAVPHAANYLLIWNNGVETKTVNLSHTTVSHTEKDLIGGTEYSYKLKAQASPSDIQYGDSEYTEGKIQAKAAVSDVKLDQTKVALASGKAVTLVATIVPSDATNKRVSWSSSNSKVASINLKGGQQDALRCTVTAHEPGVAVITVTTEDGGKTAQCTVTVSQALVAYGDLDTYLEKASDKGVTHIKITEGLSQENLKGDDNQLPPTRSPLGNILDKHKEKKVFLTLPDTLKNVNSMEACFFGCSSLVGLSGIPATVTNMQACFHSCSNLVIAPELPANLTNMQTCFYGCISLLGVTLKCSSDSVSMFSNVFKDCKALADGGIKVPHGQLASYQAKASQMGTEAKKFSEQN